MTSTLPVLPVPPEGPVPQSWTLYGVTLQSRLLLGTAGYPSPAVLGEALRVSGTQVVTVGLKRALSAAGDNGFIDIVREVLATQAARLLPNTAGCRTAQEAITLSHMARELYDTPWIKLEVVGDEHTLQPDPWELVRAAEQLVRDGFHVFPYCTDDLVTCQRCPDNRAYGGDFVFHLNEFAADFRQSG